MVIQVNEETFSGAMAVSPQAHADCADARIWDRGEASLELELRTCMQH